MQPVAEAAARHQPSGKLIDDHDRLVPLLSAHPSDLVILQAFDHIIDVPVIERVGA